MSLILIWIIAGIVGTIIAFIITREELEDIILYKRLLLALLLVCFGVLTLASILIVILILIFIWLISND